MLHTASTWYQEVDIIRTPRVKFLFMTDVWKKYSVNVQIVVISSELHVWSFSSWPMCERNTVWTYK